MNKDLKRHMLPEGATKYLFFGGKGGVGKTTVATATAVWFADHGYQTTIVSTDPTVSLSAMFSQEIKGDARVPIRHVSNLCGLNINPNDAKGVFQQCLNSVIGQQQRVTIARSLANNPKILLADEPTGNLDTRSSIEIIELFRKLNLERRQTIVMVTHSPEIGRMADRIIHFRDGKIENQQ